MDVLDASDKPTGETLPLVGGEVRWSYRPPTLGRDGTMQATEVRRHGTLNLAGPVAVNVVARRFRPWTEFALPDERRVRFHLGVYTASLPPRSYDGVIVTRTLDLLGKTALYRRKIPAPVTVPPANNIGSLIRDELRLVFGETRTAIEGNIGSTIQPFTFPASTSHLEKWNTLLQSAGFDSLSSSANGLASAYSLSSLNNKGAEWTYGPGARLVPAGDVDALLPELPNVVRFSGRQTASLGNSVGNGIEVRKNQSTGPASIDSRKTQGFDGIIELDVQVDTDSQARLVAVADAEAQHYFAGGGLRFKGKVGLNPLHGERDVVALEHPPLDLAGDWIVTDWAYPLRPLSQSGGVMDITVEQRVEVT